MYPNRRNRQGPIDPNSSTDTTHLVDKGPSDQELVKKQTKRPNRNRKSHPQRRNRNQRHQSPTKNSGYDSPASSASVSTPPTSPVHDEHQAQPAKSSPTKNCRRRNNRRSGRRSHQNRNNKRRQRTDSIDLPDESLFTALDCEMVGLGPNGNTSSVARVTLIDWHGETLFDEYIEQTQEVTDYRTFVSGITPEQLDSEDANTITLEQCRIQVKELLQDRILVGHALKNDLRSLNISHPWWLTRDTAKYEPFMQVRFDDGILWPRKLKDLCSEKLSKDIQVPGQAHCPYEDASAALDLYKSVQTKWEKVIQYKISKTNQIQKRQQKQEQQQEHHHDDTDQHKDHEEYSEEEPIDVPTPAPQ